MIEKRLYSPKLRCASAPNARGLTLQETDRNTKQEKAISGCVFATIWLYTSNPRDLNLGMNAMPLTASRASGGKESIHAPTTIGIARSIR